MPEQQLTEEDIKNMSPEQIAELQKQNCLFCQLSSEKIPAKRVYDDEICFAILDINPATKGHILLMPKEHFMILPQVPENVILHLGKVAKQLSQALIVGLGAEGTNIFIANGALAGQKAPHLIVHIIPREENDGLTCFDLPEKEITNADLLKTQKTLAGKLGTKLEEPKKEKLEEIDLKKLKNILK